MPLIGNSIKPEKTGKSGVNTRIYQSFYSISEEEILSRPERMSLSTGPKDNAPFGDDCYMVLAPCKLEQIREMIIWQFAVIGGLPYFCG